MVIVTHTECDVPTPVGSGFLIWDGVVLPAVSSSIVECEVTPVAHTECAFTPVARTEHTVSAVAHTENEV